MQNQSNDSDDIAELIACQKCPNLFELIADACTECYGALCSECLDQLAKDGIEFTCARCKAKQATRSKYRKFMEKGSEETRQTLNWDALTEYAKKVESQPFLRSQAKQHGGRLPAR